MEPATEASSRPGPSSWWTRPPRRQRVLSPANYKHLSCVAQIILRWEAPEDPDGIFGYQVELQTVLGAGYGEPLTFGWMVSTLYDATQRTDCNSTYRWRVLTSDLQMNEGLQSEWAYFIIDPPGR